LQILSVESAPGFDSQDSENLFYKIEKGEIDVKSDTKKFALSEHSVKLDNGYPQIFSTEINTNVLYVRSSDLIGVFTDIAISDWSPTTSLTIPQSHDRQSMSSPINFWFVTTDGPCRFYSKEKHKRIAVFDLKIEMSYTVSKADQFKIENPGLYLVAFEGGPENFIHGSEVSIQIQTINIGSNNPENYQKVMQYVYLVFEAYRSEGKTFVNEFKHINIFDPLIYNFSSYRPLSVTELQDSPFVMLVMHYQYQMDLNSKIKKDFQPLHQAVTVNPTPKNEELYNNYLDKEDISNHFMKIQFKIKPADRSIEIPLFSSKIAVNFSLATC
jgi:hypothetical protein